MRLFGLLLLIAFFSSCEFHTEVKTPSSSSSSDSKTSSGSKIRNGIKLKSGGLEVSQAFLVYPDGSLVPEENLTKVNEDLKLVLRIDKGWKVENDKVEIGASEKVTTSEGNVILDEKDLFKDQGPANASDASVITLRVSITQINKLFDYYQVDFRVWDKKGTNEVSGSYRFNLK